MFIIGIILVGIAASSQHQWLALILAVLVGWLYIRIEADRIRRQMDSKTEDGTEKVAN